MQSSCDAGVTQVLLLKQCATNTKNVQHTFPHKGDTGIGLAVGQYLNPDLFMQALETTLMQLMGTNSGFAQTFKKVESQASTQERVVLRYIPADKQHTGSMDRHTHTYMHALRMLFQV
jgi:hypothetical protein